MSRKHHTKHFRSASNYPARLAARGASSASVRMPFFDRRGRAHDTIDLATRRNTEANESATQAVPA